MINLSFFTWRSTLSFQNLRFLAVYCTQKYMNICSSALCRESRDASRFSFANTVGWHEEQGFWQSFNICHTRDANDWDPMAGYLNGLWGKISGQPRVIKPEVLEHYWSARGARPMASQDLRSTDLRLTWGLLPDFVKKTSYSFPLHQQKYDLPKTAQ